MTLLPNSDCLTSPKAVVLISGGLDSATCLAIARSLHYTCYALSFHYGQKNAIELQAAQKIAQALGAQEHRIVNLDFNQFGGSALTDPSLPVPTAHLEHHTIPITYVPARNTVFLSIAVGWAEILQAQHVFTGICGIDYSGYPDCRPEYLQALQRTMDLATKTGIEGQPIRIHAPLLYLSKAETIREGTRLGVHYHQTLTCYQPTTDGLACGQCDSCHYRRKGFHDAGITDPTRYQQKVTIP
jgi:7-cyano-7-deazaguanine synthase